MGFRAYACSYLSLYGLYHAVAILICCFARERAASTERGRNLIAFMLGPDAALVEERPASASIFGQLTHANTDCAKQHKSAIGVLLLFAAKMRSVIPFCVRGFSRRLIKGRRYPVALPCHDEEHGFTLVELLVVLAILGLLIGLVGPAMMRQLGSAKHRIADQSVERLAGILDLYRLDVGSYPTTQQGLAALNFGPCRRCWLEWSIHQRCKWYPRSVGTPFRISRSKPTQRTPVRHSVPRRGWQSRWKWRRCRHRQSLTRYTVTQQDLRGANRAQSNLWDCRNRVEERHRERILRRLQRAR